MAGQRTVQLGSVRFVEGPPPAPFWDPARGPAPFNPVVEAWPGGPHPAVVAGQQQMPYHPHLPNPLTDIEQRQQHAEALRKKASGLRVQASETALPSIPARQARKYVSVFGIFAIPITFMIWVSVYSILYPGSGAGSASLVGLVPAGLFFVAVLVPCERGHRQRRAEDTARHMNAKEATSRWKTQLRTEAEQLEAEAQAALAS